MAKVIVKQLVNAEVSKVYHSWHDEFADIYKFNPNITDSRLLGDSPVVSGVGATRQCDLSDGKNWIHERVTDAVTDQRLVVDIYAGSLPLKSAVISFDFTALSAKQTELVMTMDFEPKFGLVGQLMIPIMKRQFAPMLQTLLKANAHYVEGGAQQLTNQQAA